MHSRCRATVAGGGALMPCSSIPSGVARFLLPFLLCGAARGCTAWHGGGAMVSETLTEGRDPARSGTGSGPDDSAHNPKVAGSNPAPATIENPLYRQASGSAARVLRSLESSAVCQIVCQIPCAAPGCRVIRGRSGRAPQCGRPRPPGVSRRRQRPTDAPTQRDAVTVGSAARSASEGRSRNPQYRGRSVWRLASDSDRALPVDMCGREWDRGWGRLLFGSEYSSCARSELIRARTVLASRRRTARPVRPSIGSPRVPPPPHRRCIGAAWCHRSRR